MRRMRAAVVAVFAALTLVGCGGENLGAGGESASSLLKPGAIAYWESISDTDSDQWQQVEELLGRFPDGDKWIAQLKQDLAEDEGVDWEQDVKPALGDQVAVAVYSEAGAGEPRIVGLTNTDDPDKTLALIRKLNSGEESPTVERVVDDWVVVSDSEAAIDAALKGEGRALADDENFKSAMEELPDDALTTAYVNPAAALRAFGALDPDAEKGFELFGLDQIDFAGAWAKAKDDGAELAFALRGEGADKLLGSGDPYASALLDRVPEDAFAFTTFRGEGMSAQFQQFQESPFYKMFVQELEREFGFKLAELAALFDGEVAFFARPGAPIPELTLLLDSDNAEQSRESAARLLRTLAERGDGQVTEDGGVTTARFEGFSVSVGSLEDAVIVTTSRNAIADLRAEGGKLADSERYKAAIEAAGAPDQYTGLAYVDLAETIELIMGFADSSGEDVPPEISRNLQPLKSLVAYGTLEGNVASGVTFVEID
jgi:Protein of unknown function (DUF3352)